MNTIPFVGKLIEFLKETRVEVKKVNWPSPRETLIDTAIVLAFSIAVAILLGSSDYIFSQLFSHYIVK